MDIKNLLYLKNLCLLHSGFDALIDCEISYKSGYKKINKRECVLRVRGVKDKTTKIDFFYLKDKNSLDSIEKMIYSRNNLKLGDRFINVSFYCDFLLQSDTCVGDIHRANGKISEKVITRYGKNYKPENLQLKLY